MISDAPIPNRFDARKIRFLVFIGKRTGTGIDSLLFIALPRISKHYDERQQKK